VQGRREQHRDQHRSQLRQFVVLCFIHLAEKSSQFMPSSVKGRKNAWNGCFGRLAASARWPGQPSHFVNHAKSVPEGDHFYAHPNVNRWRKCMKSRPAVQRRHRRLNAGR
jgi:hypothetical protein